ncbi:hypothetical protein FQZ97_769990 [compost metagenome]
MGGVNRLTRGQWTVGVAQFNRAHALNALRNGQFGVARAHGGLVARGHEIDQADDDEDGGDKREERRPQQLGWRLDRSGVVFVRVVAHGVLKGGETGPGWE